MKNLILTSISIIIYSTIGMGQCNIADQSLSIAQSSFVCSGTTTVDLASSENGVLYFLRDNTTDEIISGPVAGTGSAISLSTGYISSNISYNVYASQNGPSIALDFDGVDDFVDVSALPGLITSTEFTMEFWVKIPSQSSGTILSINNSSYADKFAIYVSGNNLFVAEGMSGTTGSFNVADNNWHHVAVISDGSDTRVYVDYNYDFTAAGIAPTFVSGDVAAFGQDYDSGPLTSEHLTGAIDNFRVWNEQRTITQMQSDVQVCPGPGTPGLAAFYNFEDGTGSSTLSDVSGNGADGTLVNMDPSSDWITGGASCSDCQSEMSTIVTAAVTNINDQSLAATPNELCGEGVSTIQLGSSDPDVKYWLRYDSNDSVVDGPVTGNGSSITLTTDTISTTTTYNVFANKGGAGVNFDAPDESIELEGHNLDGLSTFTIEAWIKPDVLLNNEQTIASNYDYTATNNQQFRFAVGPSGELMATTSTVNGFSSTTSGVGVVQAGQWQHVAFVYDGTNLIQYVNGTQVDSYAGLGGALEPSNHNTFLGSANASGRWLDGSIDEVRFWSVALSQNDLQSNMNSCLSGSETGLINYYNFENGTGFTLPDIAGSADGQLLGLETSDWVEGSNTCDCEQEMTSTVTITVHPQPVLSVISVTDEINGNDGAIDIGVSNGTGNYAYDWDNDGTGDFDDPQDLTGLTGGTYTVVLMDSTGCSDTLEVTVNSQVGIADAGNALEFNLYPNPSDGTVYVDLGNAPRPNTTIQVLNTLGEIVLTKNGGAGIIELDLNSVRTGLYFIQTLIDDQVRTKRLVIR